MIDISCSEEPVLDSRSRTHGSQPSQHEIEDHRSQNAMYIRLPAGGRFQPDLGSSQPRSGSGTTRSKRRRRQKERRESLSGILEEESDPHRGTGAAGGLATDPSQHIMFLLGEDDEECEEPHHLFCEMDEFSADASGISEWREAARWIKFEEDVEEGGERWSKPHVATLSLYSLFEVRNCLVKGTVILNMEAHNLEQIVEYILNKLVSDGQLKSERRQQTCDVLLQRHHHLHEKKHKQLSSLGSQIPLIRSMADIGRKHSSRDVEKEAAQAKSSGLRLKGSQPALLKTCSSANMPPSGEHGDGHVDEIHVSPSSQKFDLHFMKKIPPGAEASNIWVGECDFLEQPLSCFVRLKEALMLGEVTEVPVPTRFIFILLGPPSAPGSGSTGNRYHELGRSMATLMSDEVFHDVGYKARNKDDLLAGVDEFLSSSTVLPPGEWDPTIRIEPPKSVPCQDGRKTGGTNTGGLVGNGTQSVPYALSTKGDESEGTRLFQSSQALAKCSSSAAMNTANSVSLAGILGSDGGTGKGLASGGGAGGGKDKGDHEMIVSLPMISHSPDEGHCDPTLVRTGRLFGGLLEDVKRRAPHFLTDFTDGFHVQCAASFFFLYFACLAPIITFGGLLAKETGGYLGTVESIMSGCIVGVTYSLFAGQPLTIMGSTGPVLVFEKIVYSLCQRQEWDYLSFRVCIGLWLSLFLLIMVAFDLSALVRFITRFTEESFAALIALIFIVEAVKKLITIGSTYPVDTQWYPGRIETYNSCVCVSKNRSNTHQYLSQAVKILDPNSTFLIYNESNHPVDIDYNKFTESYVSWNWQKVYQYCNQFGGKWLHPGCAGGIGVPDVFFFSCLIFIGTFVISYGLKNMRTSPFLPTRARSLISDFAVMIAISSMTLTDFLFGFHTPKLDVPSKFAPTLGYRTRGWFITPLNGNPFYTIFLAIGPALLATILIFMDQQITAVIVNRKENKLKKGCGYHLDLLIVTILIAVCSIMGIPWFVAATVLSINHVMSLKKESENTAPGERPVFLGCRENRLTGVCIFLTIGLSVFLTKILQRIPMAVLYGVFLYMGISSLRGVQLMQRVMLVFMPAKYQPDYIFLRHVPILRVHLFTLAQVVCLGLLWAIKSISSLSIAFPLMVLAMCFVRKGLEFVFTYHELKWLDDIMPDTKFRRDLDKKTPSDANVKIVVDECGSPPPIYMSTEKGINISEEVSKTSIWQRLVNLNKPVGSDSRNSDAKSKKKHKARRRGNSAPNVEGGEAIPLATKKGDGDDESVREDGGDSAQRGGSKPRISFHLGSTDIPPEIVVNPPSNRGSPHTSRRDHAPRV